MRQAIGYILCGCLLTLAILTSLGVTGSVLSGGALVLDSTGANPAAPNSAYQSKMFTKTDSNNAVGYYRLYRGVVTRFDPPFTKSFIWPSWTATDSTLFHVVPIGGGLVIDSFKIRQVGASSVTFRVGRLRGGVYTQMLSSTYTVTGTMTAATGTQNNTLYAGDQVFIVIASISGTATSIDLEAVGRYVQ